jgi:glycine/D-amino acid oxidase-like deaminating enzyme
MSAEPVSYWLAASPRGPRRPALRGPAAADIAIVGGGFTGLWTAIQLADAEPGLRIVVLEQEEVGFGASGRNGGFCSASLTHGRANGVLHFPDEIDELQRLGVENLAELCAFVDREGIVCDLERSGAIGVATEPWQAEQFEREARDLPADSALRYYDRAQIQAEVHSPRFLAGFEEGPEHNVMLDPAKLARGLADAVARRGVAVHEGPRVRRLVPLFVPVYDYVLVTEPLTADRRASIGWARRQGLSDSGYQFHYFRLTADDRILWGGYDAVYHPGNEVKPDHDRRPATFDMLEAHFRETFPQLGDIGFAYRWGGAIDTSTRFCVTFGETMGGRVVYALGYTGLGVGAARWAGSVVRDWLLRPDSELLKLRLVRSTPFPIPPEPLRTPAVGLMRHEIARADANEGRRSIFLRALDALGIGFDS